MAVITIVGSGMMGSALAFPAAENGHEVRLVGSPLDGEIIDGCRKDYKHPKLEKKFPDGVKFYKIGEVKEALCGSDVVIIGVSSFGVEWVKESLIPILPDKTIALSVTKGLLTDEEGNCISYPEYWEKEAAKLNKNISFNAIGGPCTSYELVAHDHTEVCFCGRDEKDLRFLKSLMKTSYYHISLTNDVKGLEAAVALKNGYALGITLTIGLNKKEFGEDSPLHFNSQAGVFYESVKEMKKLLEFFKAEEKSFYIGVGDLYVTVYGGRTRLVGILLGKGLTIKQATEELKGVTLESLVIIKRVAFAVKKLAERKLLNIKDFPLLMHVDGILNDDKPADINWDDFTYEEI